MSNGRSLSAEPTDAVESSTFTKDFLALIKIGIVNSNLITVFTGLWLAFQFSDKNFLDHMDILVYTIVGSALIIAGSAAMNNYIDTDIDPLMASKRARPTVTGRFKPSAVLALAISFIVIGELFLFSASVSAGLFGIAGILAYVVLYSMWSKRRHVGNTIVGSISGAIPPLIGWAAVEPALGTGAWALFLIMFIWQPPHFYALAMKRTEEYRAANIPMLPVVKGFHRTKKSMLAWILLLFPLPFLLMELGIGFIILATALNIGWLVLAIRGFKAADDLKWAKKMFIYSLNYMTILFVSMIIFAVFV
ncbi:MULTISPECIES: heme o synthase [unclassified Planococcus (in: firmicutes)]|uniref:heme o synthase n=1 Tax=Planococcus TaxID=1372 RepID=UPI000C33C04E|nr:MULTISPECIES: heme o synthase [unclassified Planococcus (in: firmicutes)]AUD14191.1 protoheme IX farnesyltransferase [Planococcus sp. MB-3u-03]PKG48218.1 protoheme IX farnesyltransferase [Planococcus sp. Urea-trap-24]PKG92066.1 protoheme IX farnesyltransferase [Planococcus sp. Urea-3u-39]PKH43030.1 protoheme IX farnesyltransferase [Planococcus sp. MB-3u-09]